MKTTVLLAFAVGLSVWGYGASAQEADAPVEVAVPEELTVASQADITTDTETVGKLKIQNIRIEDRFGAIEEDRVQAMRSELRYVPTGSAEGYNLVSSNGSQGKSQSAHQGLDMKIPSWNLFSW